MSYALHVITIVLALAISAAGGGFVAQLTFRWAKIPDGPPAATHESALPQQPEASGAVPNAAAPPPPELLRGGRTIGILERLAITGLLIAGYPTGIAAIVAIKGLGRFHELKGPNGLLASEKFVIGTLASYLWAGLIAVIAATVRSHI